MTTERYPSHCNRDPLDIPPLKVEDAKPRGVTVAEERITKRMERKAGHQVRLDDTFYPTFLTPLPALVYHCTTRLFSWHLSLLPPAHLHRIVAQDGASMMLYNLLEHNVLINWLPAPTPNRNFADQIPPSINQAHINEHHDSPSPIHTSFCKPGWY